MVERRSTVGTNESGVLLAVLSYELGTDDEVDEIDEGGVLT